MNALSRNEEIAAELLAAYGRNSGNPFDCHYDQSAAVQWMADALVECDLLTGRPTAWEAFCAWWNEYMPTLAGGDNFRD